MVSVFLLIFTSEILLLVISLISDILFILASLPEKDPTMQRMREHELDLHNKLHGLLRNFAYNTVKDNLLVGIVGLKAPLI